MRTPAEHRGVPLAFVPFVATQKGALEALVDGPLFGEVHSHVGRAFKALKDAERHNPQCGGGRNDGGDGFGNHHTNWCGVGRKFLSLTTP